MMSYEIILAKLKLMEGKIVRGNEKIVSNL